MVHKSPTRPLTLCDTDILPINFSRETLYRASFYLAFASAVAILLSIAASQVLLGMSLAALFGSRAKLRMPPVWLPLALFCAGTLVSLAFSPEPMHGLPQVKKMFVFAMLLVVFSTVRDVVAARHLVMFWGAIGAAVSCLGVVQFIRKVFEAAAQHRNFYEFYTPNRITGTMSHWMTFAGQEMIVLLMLLAFLLFAPHVRTRGWMWILFAFLLAAAELLNETRTAWIGLAAAGVWLLWRWKPRMVLALPAVMVVLAVVPGGVHDRFVSIIRPGHDDSNSYRWLAVRTGVRMIEAHPLLGIGPDETKYHFRDWMPPDRPEPLPSGYYQHLENLYLQYAAERGIPTLLMMVWLLGMVVWDFFRRLRTLPPGRSNERFLLQGGIATVIAIVVSGLGEVNLGDTEVLTVFLVVVACGYVAVGQRVSSTPLSEQLTKTSRP
ncbi:MAG: O-antigen polymerase [Bryobacterales bacterium]|nr:O-antigen polymerase [Bryobacterales bacterium]